MKKARTEEQRRYADSAFAQFWASYPRKVGKFAAKRKWDALRPTPELVGKISAALAWQIPLWTEPRFIPHPATWLHQGRWEDERPQTSVEQTETSAEYLERIGFCSHTPKCQDSDDCRRKRAEARQQKGASA